jgi:hypothetical protein
VDYETFSQYVCWRIYQHNYVNETLFFRNGMSVADLMITYMQGLPFTKIQEWKANTFGYCFHSDHILAYFLNFYFITVPVLPPFPTSSNIILDTRNPHNHSWSTIHQKKLDNDNKNNNIDTTATTTLFHFMEQLRKEYPILSINPCEGTECSHTGYEQCRLDRTPSQHQRAPLPHFCHNIEPKDMQLLYSNPV